MKFAHCLVGLSLLTASIAHAQSKYAVVDMQAVILNVEEGKTARSALEKEIKDKQAELGKRKSELDKMNEEWTKQAPLLNEQARMTKQKEFQEKFMGLRNDEMAFQDEIKKKEGTATQKIAIAVTKLVNDIAKAKNFDVVFETSSAGLIYLKDPTDLTKDVIAAFEAQSKKGKTEAKK
ncbi:MAG: OmpH family outer membrane protein [Chitinophagaceae bacterium]|nr:OmpH family outer membrane protein [Oligoflexus sp.]